MIGMAAMAALEPCGAVSGVPEGRLRATRPRRARALASHQIAEWASTTRCADSGERSAGGRRLAAAETARGTAAEGRTEARQQQPEQAAGLAQRLEHRSVVLGMDEVQRRSRIGSPFL